MKKRSLAARLLAVASLLAAANAATLPLDARPHNGLGEYVKLIQTAVDNVVFPDWWFNDSAGLGYAAMGNLLALNATSEVSALLTRLEQPHYLGDPNSADYYGSRDGRHPRNWGAWEISANAQWTYANYDKAPNRPVFDPETWGASVALQRWVDGEHLVGFSASCNKSRARLHDHGGYGGGSITGTNARLLAYAALVPEAQPWWVVVGLSGGGADFDTVRHFKDLNGEATTAKANPDGFEVGAFAALNLRLRLTNELTFKPVLRLDYTNVSIAKFKETVTTSGDSPHFGLRVNRFTAESLQSRLGAALEHKSDYGPFQLIASCSVAWADEWSGNDIKLSNDFINYTGARYRIYAGQLFNDAVEFNPAFSFAFRNGLVLHGSYLLQVTFGGQFSQSIAAGLAWRF